MKKSEIKLFIELDESNIPSKIEWEADDAEFNGKKEAKSLMLSLWDEKDNVTMGIDLWTKKMMVNDMNFHFHQTLIKMADTYFRATKNKEVADMIGDFGQKFAEKLELYKNED